MVALRRSKIGLSGEQRLEARYVTSLTKGVMGLGGGGEGEGGGEGGRGTDVFLLERV